MKLLALLLVSACASDPATSTVTQEIGSYCGGSHPVMCSPWNPDGDWNFCDVTCRALDEAETGYCPEITDAERAYCANPANVGSRYCYLGQPQFPHYCVSGEFPTPPDEESP